MPQQVEQPLEPVSYGNDVFIPISLSMLRLNSAPGFDLYFRPGPEQPFVLYRERNLDLTETTLGHLEATRVTRLYVRQDHMGQYKRYIEDNLEEILSDDRLTFKDKAEILYTSAQGVVEDLLSDPSNPEDVQRGKQVVRHTVDFMTSSDFLIEDLLRTISCDYYLYTHSVNVVAFAIALAQRCGYRDRATLREMANGALMHDVGMAQIDPDLRENRSALTQTQWERMKEHPVIGYRMLSEAGNLGEVALDIVLHHHERMNGSGYPDGLAGDDLSPFVRILAIADVFDALTTDRHHQRASTSFKALNTMQREMRDELDPRFMRAFIEMMGQRTDR